MGSRYHPILIAFAIFIAAKFSVAAYAEWFWRLDAVIYDFVTVARERETSDGIVIVAIDEQSLAEIGQWAWPRGFHGELVRRLDAAGAKAIAFDVAFADRDPGDPDGNTAFADAIRDYGNVVLPILAVTTSSIDHVVEKLPSPVLMDAGADLAHVEVELDRDGVARGVFLKAGVGDPHWPALALALIEASGKTIAPKAIAQCQPSNPQASPALWHRNCLILVPFAGPPGHFPRVSFADVIKGNVAKETLEDKFVLVGATAVGLGDHFITPFRGQRRAMSGVEFQANVADALLQNEALRPAPPSWRMLFAGGLSGLTFILCTRVPRTGWIFLAAISTAALLSFLSWQFLKSWLPPSTALIGILFATALHIGLTHRSQRKARTFEQERAEIGLESISDAVIITDENGSIVFFNSIAERLTGYSASEAHGRPLEEVVDLREEHTGTARRVGGLLAKEEGSQRSTMIDAILFSKTGKPHSIRGTAAFVQVADQRSAGIVLALSDVTDLRRMAHSIEYQATHDPLTELPNRDFFGKLLAQSTVQAKRDDTCLTLILVHIDELEGMRLRFGAETTNAVMRACTARLSSCRSAGGAMGRISADEFGIIYPTLVHDESAIFLAKKLKHALEAPLDIAGFELQATASLGVGVFPRDAADARSLLARTESAMMQAKYGEGEKIRFVVGESQLTDIRQARAQSDIRNALESDRFVLHYQPLYSFALDRISGFEAVMRWRTPEGRSARAADLVTVAEEVGLASLLAEWTLRSIGTDVSSWVHDEDLPLRISIALSPEQFVHPDLPTFLANGRDESGLAPGRLAVEVTERVFLWDMQGAKTNMDRLRAGGFDVVVDEFGAGYASLLYLRNLPISGLKIPASYVHGALLAPETAAIVQAIIAMAHSMGLTVAGKGADEEAHFDFLRRENCDEAQGRFVGRPLPPDHVIAFLRDYHLKRSG